MEHKNILAGIWLLWAIIMYVADRKTGREISQWVYVAVICSTIWAAA